MNTIAKYMKINVTDEQAREQLKAFTMEGIAQNIKCPTLITHGGHDIRMSVEGAKRLFNEIGAKDKTLKIYDDPKAGGTIHCSHDYWAQHTMCPTCSTGSRSACKQTFRHVGRLLSGADRIWEVSRSRALVGYVLIRKAPAVSAILLSANQQQDPCQ